ncbi:MAG: hypothetical protein HN411_00665 [Waddliaceae bacterium]|jgi:hypothetical protein|nr:hypothetical protein [Waddliaceae bacterium]MBT3579496.1 hypothetical protein [Waddliaceae bacterium]MBT4444647.1 hypothetical protein [Waddliaceae bacterium]MBT6929212.1 hypothetical protein [Waddliaceae bacterium]
MDLKTLLDKGILKNHQTSADEIMKMFKMVKRDIGDASLKGLSTDRRFTTAYEAALTLATVILRISGYRTGPMSGHHKNTFAILPELVGSDLEDYSNYFEACRMKRNMSEYTSSGEISKSEADEILHEVQMFETLVKNWINEHYSDFKNVWLLE